MTSLLNRFAIAVLLALLFHAAPFVRAQSASIGDDFTDTNGTALTSHTASGSGGGWSWAAMEGTATIQTNRAQYASGTQAIHRAESDLSSADMRVTITQTNGNTTANTIVLGRCNSAATTCYTYHTRQDAATLTHRLFRMITGTLTQIGGTVTGNAPADNDTQTITVTGTNPVTITGSINGVQRITFDDSDANRINGNVRAGFGWSGSAIGLHVDDFLAEVVASGPSTPLIFFLNSRHVSGAARPEGM